MAAPEPPEDEVSPGPESAEPVAPASEPASSEPEAESPAAEAAAARAAPAAEEPENLVEALTEAFAGIPREPKAAAEPEAAAEPDIPKRLKSLSTPETDSPAPYGWFFKLLGWTVGVPISIVVRTLQFVSPVLSPIRNFIFGLPYSVFSPFSFGLRTLNFINPHQAVSIITDWQGGHSPLLIPEPKQRKAIIKEVTRQVVRDARDWWWNQMDLGRKWRENNFDPRARWQQALSVAQDHKIVTQPGMRKMVSRANILSTLGESATSNRWWKMFKHTSVTIADMRRATFMYEPKMEFDFETHIGAAKKLYFYLAIEKLEEAERINLLFNPRFLFSRLNIFNRTMLDNTEGMSGATQAIKQATTVIRHPLKALGELIGAGPARRAMDAFYKAHPEKRWLGAEVRDAKLKIASVQKTAPFEDEGWHDYVTEVNESRAKLRGEAPNRNRRGRDDDDQPPGPSAGSRRGEIQINATAAAAQVDNGGGNGHVADKVRVTQPAQTFAARIAPEKQTRTAGILNKPEPAIRRILGLSRKPLETAPLETVRTRG